MKIIRVTLLATFATLLALPMLGQTLFDATEINKAAKDFNAAEAKTTKWANNIVALGNIDPQDSSICYKFKIPTDDTLYIASVYDCIRFFVDQRRPERQIDYKQSTADYVVIKTTFPKIIFSDGSVSFAMSIDAYGEMDIDIQPTDLIITMKVQRYVNTSPYGKEVEPSYGSIWLPVGGVAPFKDNGNTKLWCKAFINSNAECLNLANTFVGIMNANYTKPDFF